MGKRSIILCLCLCMCLLPALATAVEGAYLSADELRGLEPTFEAFLEEMADVLVDKGLLSPTEREAWILYQLGDFMQNGGFGTMTIGYTSGGWGREDDPVAMRRFLLETPAGTLYLETLGQYEESYSPLPGLPLDTELMDENGAAVPCRFRWTATSGSFEIWDNAKGETVPVGITYTSEGEPLYWYEEPIDGIDEVLTLDILSEEDDTVPLATVKLTVRSENDAWKVEELE